MSTPDEGENPKTRSCVVLGLLVAFWSVFIPLVLIYGYVLILNAATTLEIVRMDPRPNAYLWEGVYWTLFTAGNAFVVWIAWDLVELTIKFFRS